MTSMIQFLMDFITEPRFAVLTMNIHFGKRHFFSLSFPLIKFELSSNMSVLILPSHIATERHLLCRLFKPKIVERKQFFSYSNVIKIHGFALLFVFSYFVVFLFLLPKIGIYVTRIT